MEHTQTTPENMDIPTTTTTPGKKEEDIILVTSDDQHRSIPMSTINLFNTIKNAIQDQTETTNESIKLPYITGEILDLILKYANYRKYNPCPVVTTKKQKNTIYAFVDHWDKLYCADFSPNTLYDMFVAVNYLEYNDLLRVLCKTAFNMIKGQTPSEIRKNFGIRDDFSDEQRSQLKKDYPWCQESTSLDYAV